MSSLKKAEADSEGGARGRTRPFFAITCFFCSHFKKLQTVLFEVEMIINNAPLTYVYPNTIETCLTPIIYFFADNFCILLTQHQM